DPGHGFNVLGEAASIGSKACGQARGLVLLALREKAALAIKTLFAGYVMKAHHAVAGSEFCETRPGCNDGASQFVTEDLRRVHVTSEDFLNIGAADAAGSDFDQDFVGTDFGDGDFFDANNT